MEQKQIIRNIKLSLCDLALLDNWLLDLDIVCTIFLTCLWFLCEEVFSLVLERFVWPFLSDARSHFLQAFLENNYMYLNFLTFISFSLLTFTLLLLLCFNALLNNAFWPFFFLRCSSVPLLLCQRKITLLSFQFFNFSRRFEIFKDAWCIKIRIVIYSVWSIFWSSSPWTYWKFFTGFILVNRGHCKNMPTHKAISPSCWTFTVIFIFL